MTLLNIYISIICICLGFRTSNFEFMLEKLHSTNYYVRIYQQIMQNKPNFPDAQMSLTNFKTMNYKILSRWPVTKTNPIKPKTNPI